MVGCTDGFDGTVVEDPVWLPPELLPPASGDPTGLSPPLEELLLGGGEAVLLAGVWLLVDLSLVLRFCGPTWGV